MEGNGTVGGTFLIVPTCLNYVTNILWWYLVLEAGLWRLG
jgi:hypothetical protein